MSENLILLVLVHEEAELYCYTIPSSLLTEEHIRGLSSSNKWTRIGKFPGCIEPDEDNDYSGLDKNVWTYINPGDVATIATIRRVVCGFS